MLNINFVKEEPIESEGLVVLIDNQLKVDPKIIKLDSKIHGLISKVVQNPDLFSGKFGSTRTLTYSGEGGALKRIILLGTGDESKLEESSIEELGGKIFSAAKCAKIKNLGIFTERKLGNFSISSCASSIGSGILLKSYSFDKYFTGKKEGEKFKIEKVDIFTDNIEESEKIFIEKKAIATAVYLARNCVSEPANILYPESYSEIITEELEDLGVEVEIFGEREMKNMGMGALLGVGQGSQNESKLVVMKYIGDDKHKAPVALVGKGVTFDTGGISLKPSLNMHDMKYDMAGSAAVFGTIKALALRKAKVNVVGVVGLVENMPSGHAQRPGDVVKTMSGKTVEVLNTDAEGRLVLADAMWYAQEKFNPLCLVDVATLTGAITVCLGNSFAGCFSNDEELAGNLIKSGEKVKEKLWRMPLHPDYDEAMDSEIADVANISSVPGAGSSTAAQFLARFLKDGVKWAHLDIAGMAWKKKESNICPKGASGYGVRLLNSFIKDYYESK